MTTLVILIGIGFWIMHRFGKRIRIPNWVWFALGMFLIFMLARHLSDGLAFAGSEADAWWPIVKENAAKMTAGLRGLIQQFDKGG